MLPFRYIPLLFVLAVPSQALRQEPAPEATLRVNTQLVLADVSVVNKNTGQAVGPLTLNDLRVTEDGTPQPLTSINRQTLPLSVVFLLDLTDTVQPVLRNLARGAQTVVEHLQPGDEAAVMAFASHTRLLLGFSRDHARIADALAHAGDMASREPTYLDHSMFEAAAQAEQSTVPHSRRVLLWLTDGTSNNQGGIPSRMARNPETPDNPHTKQEATEALLRSGAASAMLRERSGRTYAQMPMQWMSGHSTEFDDYATLTGGPVATTGKDDAAARMGMLLDEFRARTTIGFKPTASKPAGTLCHLQWSLAPDFFTQHPDLNPERKNLVVRARREYLR